MLDTLHFDERQLPGLLLAYQTNGRAYCPSCRSTVPLAVTDASDELGLGWYLKCRNRTCNKSGTFRTPRPPREPGAWLNR